MLKKVIMSVSAASLMLAHPFLIGKDNDNDNDSSRKKGSFQQKNWDSRQNQRATGNKKFYQSSQQGEKKWKNPQKFQKNERKPDNKREGRYRESQPSRSLLDSIIDDFRGPENRKNINTKQGRVYSGKTERFSRKNLKQREGVWEQRGGHFRNDFKKHHKRDKIFDDHYWNQFRAKHDHWYFDPHFNWYVAAPWTQVRVWLPWRWDNSIYYYYDDRGIGYYSIDQNDPYLIPLESNSTLGVDPIALANSSKNSSKTQGDWIPLGTYALVGDDDAFDSPREFISLAVSKEGSVSGAYVNLDNNIPQQIEGAVDENTQLIAWKFVGQEWPVMETGLYNLTQKESTLLTHLSDSKIETRVIVQVEK